MFDLNTEPFVQNGMTSFIENLQSMTHFPIYFQLLEEKWIN